MKHKPGLSALLLTATMTLTACGGGGNEAPITNAPAPGNQASAGGSVAIQVDTANALASLDVVLAQFPEYHDNGLPHVAGSILQVGISQPAPLAGLFGTSLFWNSADDSAIGEMLGTTTSLLSTTELLQFGQEGVVNYSIDQANSTLTFTMQHDVYWHDGVPLTLDDLVFAYHVMADASYTGVRFSSDNRHIAGIMDFHNGEADHISGLILSDDHRTLTIHFETMSPTILYFGIHTSPMPRHIFGHMAVADIPGSPEAQTGAVGWGPFILENVVPGESVYLRRNENFVFGVPYVESLIVRRVVPELALTGMAAGTFDVILPGVPTAYFGDHMSPSNFHYIGFPTGTYGYVSFRMGTWDTENHVNVVDPERLMNQLGPDFRRAMALAIDYDLLGQSLHNGLQFMAGSNMAPIHRGFMDSTVPGLGYDPVLANEILDNAGFTERDSEGYRLTPAGEPLTVIWAHQTNALEDILIPFHIQGWAAIGIRVELWRGQTHDQVYLWDVLDFDTDNQEIHLYSGAWTAGFDPNPSGTWGHAVWNPSRHTSAEQELIFDRITSEDTWDHDYLLQVLSDWQWYWYNTVPFFPTLWGVGLHPINNRIANWDPRPETGNTAGIQWHTIRLTTENPY